MKAFEKLVQDSIDNKVTPLQTISKAEKEVAALRRQLDEAREVMKPFADADERYQDRVGTVDKIGLISVQELHRLAQLVKDNPK
jgi:hypothetical protein